MSKYPSDLIAKHGSKHSKESSQGKEAKHKHPSTMTISELTKGHHVIATDGDGNQTEYATPDLADVHDAVDQPPTCIFCSGAHCDTRT